MRTVYKEFTVSGEPKRSAIIDVEDKFREIQNHRCGRQIKRYMHSIGKLNFKRHVKCGEAAASI